MTTLREAAQMALETLVTCRITNEFEPGSGVLKEIDDSITALRAALANEFNPDWDAMAVMVEVQQRMAKRIEELESALAQPEPEPVAWWHDMGDVVDLNVSGRGTPLYTAPQQREWQGLTDEEIEDACWTEVDQRLRSFARAIEAKLKEKNA